MKSYRMRYAKDKLVPLYPKNLKQRIKPQRTFEKNQRIINSVASKF